MAMSLKTDPIESSSTRWDPKLYRKFSDQRLRPALELLERIPLGAPKVIYDLGCGPGHVTRIIAERWPSATVYGVDHSKEMLDQAAAVPGTVKWIEADIRAWSPDRIPDLLYSNATLHWVEGHHVLFPRLAGLLKAGGCLAVQMPLSWDAPSHRLMRETLATGGVKSMPWSEPPRTTRGGRRPPSRPSTDAPMVRRGIVTLSMGRAATDRSPWRTLNQGRGAQKPASRRIEVPELPTSMMASVVDASPSRRNAPPPNHQTSAPAIVITSTGLLAVVRTGELPRAPTLINKA